MRYLPLSVLLVACAPSANLPGSDPEVKDTAASVTNAARLTPVGRDTGTFFDSTLNAECHIDAVSESDVRCFPRVGTRRSSLFSDETCSTPVYVPSAASCGELPTLVLAQSTVFASDTLFGQWFAWAYQPFTRGEAVARPAAFFTRRASGCKPVLAADAPPADATVYALSPADAATYAAGQVSWKPGTTGAIEKPVVVMDGGVESSYFWMFARDTKNDALCDFGMGYGVEAPVERECALSGARVASYVYTDATCQAQAYAVPASSSPRFISVDGMTYATKVTSTQKIYNPEEEAMCVESTNEYKVLGFDAPLWLAQGTTKTSGTGRVLRRSIVADGLEFDDTLLDDKGRPCNEYTFAGVKRCVGGEAYGTEVYSDAECTQALVDLYDPPAAKAVFRQRSGCGQDDVIRLIGDATAVDTVYSRNLYGACREATYVNGNLHVLGDVVAPETFPTID